jgi:hypothetical protein
MVKKILFFVLLIFILSACSQQDTEEYESVREVVWDYIEGEGLVETGVYTKEMWNGAIVNKGKMENEYKKFIDDTYDGKEIYLVSLDGREVVASPTFLVDQDFEKVIGVIEGS